jgi:hypothetical protein
MKISTLLPKVLSTFIIQRKRDRKTRHTKKEEEKYNKFLFSLKRISHLELTHIHFSMIFNHYNNDDVQGNKAY